MIQKSIQSGLLALLLAVLAMGRSYGFSGEGTLDAPYLIQSAEDLFTLSSQVGGGERYEGVYFFQTVDIDLRGEPWEPIGSELNPFLGSYDGAGHTVANLVISGDRSSRLGLFGLVGKGGATGRPYLSGVRLKKVAIRASRKVEDLAVGALVGEVRGGYTVRGCAAEIRMLSFDGTAGGGVSLGGLIGVADGCELWDCWAEAEDKKAAIEVTSNEVCAVGGLVGRFEGYAMEKTKAQVQRAYADVKVRANVERSAVGGFIGYVKDVWVADCFSLGDVWSGKCDAGTFIGSMQGSGRCCYSMGRLYIDESLKNPLMLGAGGEECDNYYYRRYSGLFIGGPKEKFGSEFSVGALEGRQLPEGFSHRSWEVRSGQPPILKMKIGGMSVR